MARELRYRQVAAALRRQIERGQLAPGALIASEAELAHAHRASRNTVRRALHLLKDDHLIDSRQGFGWYVVTPPLRRSLRDLTTLERQVRASGRTFTRELLTFSFIQTPSEFSGFFATSSLLEFTRLDRIDTRPFAIATVWVVEHLVRDLTPQDIESQPLSQRLAVEVAGATETITAVGASASDAKYLGARKGMPLLHVDRVVRDVAAQPILRSRARYNPLLTAFVIELPPAAAPDELPSTEATAS